MFLEILFFSALAILVGLAFCFLGFQLFRILLPIWAFLVGLWFGAAAMAALTGGGFLTTALGLVVGVFLGLILAALSYFVFALAVLLFGVSLGYTLGAGLMLLLGLDPGVISFTVGIIFAFAFGLMFVVGRFPKLFIMIATAFGGAMAVFAGIFILFGVMPPESLGLGFANAIVGNSFLLMLGWIILAVLGLVAQYAAVEEREALMVDTFDIEAVMAGEKASTSKKK